MHVQASSMNNSKPTRFDNDTQMYVSPYYEYTFVPGIITIIRQNIHKCYLKYFPCDSGTLRKQSNDYEKVQARYAP